MKSTSFLAQTDDESTSESELRMEDLGTHLKEQFLTDEWGFRPYISYQGTTLIGTAYGVISMRYFGLEDKYSEDAPTYVQDYVYNHSKTADNMYWFLNTIGGIGSIHSTWAGITTLYTLNNLSLVDFGGVTTYIDQFRDSSGGYAEIGFSSLESTYWAIETLRLIDPLTPSELLSSSMKVETREFILNQLDRTKYRFDDPSLNDTAEDYQLSTFYALMTLRAMDEQRVISDDADNISQWINSTQYFATELFAGEYIPTYSPLSGGFSDRYPSSEENTRLIPTAAALASLRVLNETVPEDLFTTLINTTAAEDFIIRCNLPAGGFTDHPEGSINEFSLEHVYFGIMGLLSNGKLIELLEPNPIFYTMPQNEPKPIVRGDNVSIMFSPSFYGVGPHEGLEIKLNLDGRNFGLIMPNENASIPNTYQLNLTRADYPYGMFLGNHSLATQLRLINQTLLPTFTTSKLDFMTVGLDLQYEVPERSYIPSEEIPFEGTLTDRLSDNLSMNISAVLVDPLGDEIAQTQIQASNSVFNGSIKVPNAPILGYHNLSLKVSYHTVNTTLVLVFDQAVLTFLESNSFEGPGSNAFHIGDNVSVIAQIRYNSTKDIPNAFVPNLNGSARFMYTDNIIVFGDLNETSTPGSYNLTGQIPIQLITGPLNITAAIDWPNLRTNTTDPLEIHIATDFELTERQAFSSPLTFQYGQHLNWTFDVYDKLTNQTIEKVTLAPGLANLTSSELVQEFDYSKVNNTFTVADFPDPNLLQGSYNLHIKGLLETDEESYIELLPPTPVTLAGQPQLQQLSFLKGPLVTPGQDLIIDFIIVNVDFNDTVINDLFLVSTLSGPGGTYFVNHTNLGAPPQLSWTVPEDAPVGNYTVALFRQADMLAVGAFELTVVADLGVKEPRPWQFYAVLGFSVFEAGFFVAFFRILRKRNT